MSAHNCLPWIRSTKSVSAGAFIHLTTSWDAQEKRLANLYYIRKPTSSVHQHMHISVTHQLIDYNEALANPCLFVTPHVQLNNIILSDVFFLSPFQPRHKPIFILLTKIWKLINIIYIYIIMTKLFNFHRCNRRHKTAQLSQLVTMYANNRMFSCKYRKCFCFDAFMCLSVDWLLLWVPDQTEGDTPR